MSLKDHVHPPVYPDPESQPLPPNNYQQILKQSHTWRNTKWQQKLCQGKKQLQNFRIFTPTDRYLIPTEEEIETIKAEFAEAERIRLEEEEANAKNKKPKKKAKKGEEEEEEEKVEIDTEPWVIKYKPEKCSDEYTRWMVPAVR